MAINHDPAAEASEREELKRRYELERQRRMRSNEPPPIELEGDLERYLVDPFTSTRIERESIAEDVQVLIVGGGFGGLMAAARHIEAGITDIRIVDKASDFGGTWYWNRYPGVACDIEAYVYLPLLEELDYIPKEKYAKGEEIFEHCQRIGESYGLYERALFQTEIIGMRWHESERRWSITTDRGDVIRAQFVCVASGPLQKLKLPSIPGIETFEGESFHTSRWNYQYTGGDQYGGLDGLKDKVVGIIGTGATGVQCIPHVARYAKRLYVFQRTPSAIDVRNNRATDPDWAAALAPGWTKERRTNYIRVMAGLAEKVDLVDDGWTRRLSKLLMLAGPEEIATMEQAGLPERLEQENFRIMDEIRDRVDMLVDDPEVAEALKPYYKFFCKRPCFHDEYLQTFNLPNVQLVDTRGRGIDSVSAHAIHVGDATYEVDCLILATGFEWGSDTYTKNAGFDIYGRNGVRLSEHWGEGAKTLFGIFTRGMPNLCFITHIQAGASPSYTYVADEQAKAAAHIVSYCVRHGIATFEVSADAEADWVSEVESLAGPRLAYDASCTPSFMNHYGKIDRRLARNGPHGGGPIAYVRKLDEFKSADTPPGLSFDQP